MLYFFFFKQKTAYEMRISDLSSDVCSSDLPSLTPFFAPFFVWIHTDPRRPFLSCLRGKQLPRELREQISDAGSRRERLMLLRIVRRELECGGGIELAFDQALAEDLVALESGRAAGRGRGWQDGLISG